MKKILCLIILCLASGSSFAAGGGAQVHHANINPYDRVAVISGAKYFANYCLSCHSASYMRYNRLVEDLELDEQVVLDNLIFGEQKIGDSMNVAMTSENAQEWFGKTPPDLSVIGRSRGPDWLYAYMKSFYQDETGAWNNLVFPDMSMPHVMWGLQGIQKAVYKQDEHGNSVVDHLVLAEPGSQTPEEYDKTVRELVAFLDYLGEPGKLTRKKIGVWVMLFLALFTLLAFLLKAEYWRDVH